MSKYNRTGVFDQSKIGNEHAENFQNKMYLVNFRKYRSRKKFWIGRVKIAKSKKIKKTEELEPRY